MSGSELCPGCFAEPSAGERCSRCGYQHDSAAFPSALPPGTILSRYRLGRVLGRPGGFGVTYLAFDPVLKRRLAVKELMPRDLVARRPDGLTLNVHTREDQEIFAHTLESFLNEARLIAQINHPNVVRVIDYFEANGTAYFAMEYYEGQTLAEYVAASGGRLPGAQATTLMLPLLDALDHLHSMPEPILHRDIKPANIYLTGRLSPILLDFGAARVTLNRSRSLSTVLTPGFAPYEQYSPRGNQGPWSDVYACAATMYFLVTGQIPPEASERIDRSDVPDPRQIAPSVPPSVGRAIVQGLRFRPEDRPRSAREFAALLTTDGVAAATVVVVPGTPVVSPTIPLTEFAPPPATAITPGETAKAPAPDAAHAKTSIAPPSEVAAAGNPSRRLPLMAIAAVLLLVIAAVAAAQYMRTRSTPSEQTVASVEPAPDPPAAAPGIEGRGTQVDPKLALQGAPLQPNVAPAGNNSGTTQSATSAPSTPPGTSRAGTVTAGAPPRGTTTAAAAPSPAPRTAAVPAAANPEPAPAQPVAAGPADGLVVIVYGNDTGDVQVAESTLMRALAGRNGLRALDQAALSIARGDDAAVQAASRGDFGALASVSRQQRVELLVVGDLTSRAAPSVGGFYTGTAELSLRMYQVSTGRVVATEIFRVGPGALQPVLAISEGEARSRAAQSVADAAARAAGTWAAGALRP